METAFDVFAGYEISVTTRRNERGAWVADLDVRRDGQSRFDWPETVQPEWRTADEAVRDGIERARRVIGQHLANPDNHSWVATREHAQTWFSAEAQRLSGNVFTRGE
ncbi:DUF6566 family protein [Caballeronia ptereochthonis]|uniref:DUF6566 domain-containing protein n=1 Tax=Caballeronia ptereochthonis TaxID=1777144 RepID=A0A158EB51_9BURK|nr:DUF6566 family protein [Caballeronia ptereochthonis]SAL04003.1 hypothetical protein AWB83_06932 [Caballeronia ptereochthonis]